MKRKTKMLILGAVFMPLAAVLAAGIVVKSAARGRTYDDVDAIPHRKVGLVLGTSRRTAEGGPNPFFVNRMEAAAELLTAGKVDYLLVSGDNRTLRYNETRDMRKALLKLGVPANRVYCDYAGFRTLDSIVRALRVFGQASLTIVSQRFHNERAIFIALHKGIDAIGFNAREVGSADTLLTGWREQLARVKTILDVYLLDTPPRFLGDKIRIDGTPQTSDPRSSAS
ncbi:MAG: YdcF family protein [Syntrophobacteraceae bacterium]|jgi:SanA protein|nr:YdcF family protein [Syntrophobacteraceae bacterium]